MITSAVALAGMVGCGIGILVGTFVTLVFAKFPPFPLNYWPPLLVPPPKPTPTWMLPYTTHTAGGNVCTHYNPLGTPRNCERCMEQTFKLWSVGSQRVCTECWWNVPWPSELKGWQHVSPHSASGAK